MNSEVDVERAQDLDRRCAPMKNCKPQRWPGALTVTDCLALAFFALAVVIGFYLWGGQP
ncbi:hypothetical protein [Pseudomonas plecoglossicida]|uniref:hypothetical protein n=1 Tax=Pseudomonas plecoglossicida TaxID=70775 RepID=UPI0015E100A8|nr:hypothetical protein [Pseudomonas plecoglossicida]